MLSDPLSVGSNTGIPSTWTGTSTTESFQRVGNGKFISISGLSSLDQPMRISIKPNIRLQGPSRYSLRLERDKNVAPVNGVQQADDTAFCEISFGGNYRSFSQAELQQTITMAYVALITNMTKAVAGES